MRDFFKCGNTVGGESPVRAERIGTRAFIDFFSDAANSAGIGNIQCRPGNGKGMLFKIQIVLSEPVDLNGNNDNLTMQSQSTLSIVGNEVFTPEQQQKMDKAQLDNKIPINKQHMTGVSGTVNQIQVQLTFHDNKLKGEVNLNGTITPQEFSGTMTYSNTQDDEGNPAQTGGTLGTFTISPQNAFSCIRSSLL